MNNIIGAQPGDIVRHIATGQERPVTDIRLDLGLIAFEDSNIMGWEDLKNWVPTGKRQEAK